MEEKDFVSVEERILKLVRDAENTKLNVQGLVGNDWL